MTVKLMTEQDFVFLSLIGGCTDSSSVYRCQNAALLEITNNKRILSGSSASFQFSLFPFNYSGKSLNGNFHLDSDS